MSSNETWRYFSERPPASSTTWSFTPQLAPPPVPPVFPNSFRPSVPPNNWQNRGSSGNSLLSSPSPGNSLIPTPFPGNPLFPITSSGNSLLPSPSPGNSRLPTPAGNSVPHIATPGNFLLPPPTPGSSLLPTPSLGNSFLPTSSPGNSLLQPRNLNVPSDGKAPFTPHLKQEDSKNPASFPTTAIQFSVPPPGIVPLNLPPPNIFPPRFPSLNPSGSALPPQIPILQNVPAFIPPPSIPPRMSSLQSFPSSIPPNNIPVTVPESNANTFVTSDASLLKPFTYPIPSNRFSYSSSRIHENSDLTRVKSCDKSSFNDDLTNSDVAEWNKNYSRHSERYETYDRRKYEKPSEKYRHKSDRDYHRDRTPHRERHDVAANYQSDRRDSSRRSKSPDRKHRSSEHYRVGRKNSPIKRKHSPERRRRSRSSEKRRRESRTSEKEKSSPRPSHHSSRSRKSSPDMNILQSLLTKTYDSICSSPSEEYYKKNESSKEVTATEALIELHAKFKDELVDRAGKVRALKPKYEPPARKTKLRKPKPPKTDCDAENSSSSEKSSSSEEEDTALEELEKKRKHPDRLHHELWYNDPKEMNDGPLCRCSAKARRAGIRHGIYVGEGYLPLCEPLSNNANRLHHYRITMSPHTNFLTNSPTIISHEGKDYVFEGFSMFSHSPLRKLPNCKVIRFNYEYTIMYLEEDSPANFTIQGLELFSKFVLVEILELVDLNWKAHDDPDGCPRFHFLPRFAREIDGKNKELLSLNVVLQYLLDSNKILVDEEKLPETLSLSSQEWQDLADEVKGMIVTCPGMKPSSIRVDQLDREHCDSQASDFPVIVHFGVRPPQLSYAGNPHYQKAWRDYVKFRHLLANKPKVKYVDRHILSRKEMRLQEMRMENDLKRDVTVVISSKGFYKTGIMSDVIQHAMLLPVLVCHLRFHDSLSHLEEKIGFHFRDRFLLQLALTHPSYRENFGTNPDHARNSLTNCGLRQPQYGDRRIHYMNTRKRGINTLINIMSRFGSRKESRSCINHNERLEFLGDAVVEFLSSIHLFYMFPDLEEGGLATYRAAIVQNQHLAILAKKLQLEQFMLYAHGSDLCHDLELRHAMANCFEALMGALFLDNGIEVADKVFSITLFSEPELLAVWKNYPIHPLQEQEPGGDRRWIESVPLLQKLHKFEETIGIEFTHIRLLARSLTHRSLGYNNLTLGSNQRLEFLGDTVLQLVASEYLYKYFPEHHEGHLSLLRSSLVNNRTQAVVCQDLGMVEYAIYPYDKVELKSKDKADLLEAFLGALYVDKDLGYCRKFCEVCFFPRLQDFIMNQDWNDPKSKLQQCCLTLRSMDGGEPDIPTYKVIECKGPTNTRVYSVAVYFQGNRLAVGSGHSIQQAEMDAAGNALRKSKGLFPQLKHQRRAIEKSLKQGQQSKTSSSSKSKSKARSLH